MSRDVNPTNQKTLGQRLQEHWLSVLIVLSASGLSVYDHLNLKKALNSSVPSEEHGTKSASALVISTNGSSIFITVQAPPATVLPTSVVETQVTIAATRVANGPSETQTNIAETVALSPPSAYETNDQLPDFTLVPLAASGENADRQKYVAVQPPPLSNDRPEQFKSDGHTHKSGQVRLAGWQLKMGLNPTTASQSLSGSDDENSKISEQKGPTTRRAADGQSSSIESAQADPAFRTGPRHSFFGDIFSPFVTPSRFDRNGNLIAPRQVWMRNAWQYPPQSGKPQVAQTPMKGNTPPPSKSNGGNSSHTK